MTVSSVLVRGLATGIPLATYRTLVGKDYSSDLGRPALPPARNTALHCTADS